MKKLLSLVLSTALLCTLGVPALAAETASADQRLAAVTEKVKTTLALDTAAYTAFQGDMEEGTVTPVWRLQWSGEDNNLMITATESGKILSYSLYDGTGEIAFSRNGFAATFPKLTRADAQKTAQSFLDKVLTKGIETAAFTENRAETLSSQSHSFYGTVQENGLPSPFSFRLSVRASDNTVTSFYLNGDSQNYLGELPDPSPAADAAKAGDSLKSTLKLRLEYVLNEDGKTASLRYLPESVHEYYVDAKTGALVDLTALEQEVWERGTAGGAYGSAAPSAAPDVMSKENALTEAELAGVANMEGVLSKEALEAAARKITALGLSKYTLAQVDYRSTDKETGDVSATLQFAYKSGESIYRRTVTLNAKSGALLSVYSSRPWKSGEKGTLSNGQAIAKAEAFLKEICPDQFVKTAAYGLVDESRVVEHNFQYAAKENGYFLPESCISVSVDGSDGSISSYNNSYLDGVSFDSAAGIVDMDAALSAWFGTYQVTLGYQAVPQKLDLSEPRYKPLVEMGRKYLYTRKLAYSLVREGWYEGVDAKTGAAIKGTEKVDNAITYDDLAGHWIKAQAERMAQYGVGWQGGSLKPAQALTQLDALALLVSTDGYRYNPADEKAADHLYDVAYSMGLLEKAQRNDTAPVSRGELTRLLLESAGYGNIAGLEGIFKCSFADEGSIPAEYYGYAAVAQGLGLVKGDKAGNFAAQRTATRAEAVSMLYNFMSR